MWSCDQMCWQGQVDHKKQNCRAVENVHSHSCWNRRSWHVDGNSRIVIWQKTKLGKHQQMRWRNQKGHQKHRQLGDRWQNECVNLSADVWDLPLGSPSSARETWWRAFSAACVFRSHSSTHVWVSASTDCLPQCRRMDGQETAFRWKNNGSDLEATSCARCGDWGYEREDSDTVIGVLCQGWICFDQFDPDKGWIFKRHCGYGPSRRLDWWKWTRKSEWINICCKPVDPHQGGHMQWIGANENLQNQQNELDYGSNQLGLCILSRGPWLDLRVHFGNAGIQNLPNAWKGLRNAVVESCKARAACFGSSRAAGTRKTVDGWRSQTGMHWVGTQRTRSRRRWRKLDGRTPCWIGLIFSRPIHPRRCIFLDTKSSG